jgi:hypothetical protein
MAKPITDKSTIKSKNSTAAEPEYPLTTMAVVAPIVGWLIPGAGHILDILGFVGDLGSGVLYFLARIMDWGNVMAANAAADYGKTFLIVAGLLNFIAAADAHHIALGKKP